MMSPILSSLSKQLERAEAEGLVEDLVDQPLALVAVQAAGFRCRRAARRRLGSRCAASLGSISAMRFMSSRSTRRMWIWRLSASYWTWAGSASLAARPCGRGGRRRRRPAAARRWRQVLRPAAAEGGSARAVAAAELIGDAWPERSARETLQHRNRLPSKECGEQFSSWLRRFGSQRAGRSDRAISRKTW